MVASGVEAVIAGLLLTGGKSVSRGGGIDNNGTLTLMNTIVSGNSADDGSGGGISNSGMLTLTNTTISGNSSEWGGGIRNWGKLIMYNTVVALNESARTGPDILGGLLSSSSHNFIGDASDLFGISDGENGNIVGGGDPLFVRSPSPGNDGQWGTVDDVTGDLHLMPNSPCVDAGLDALAVDAQGNPLTIDLDGGPRIIGAAVDIGAYEYHQP